MLGVGLGLTKVRKAAGAGTAPAEGTPIELVITVHGATTDADVTPTMLAARQLGTWTGSSYKYTNDVVPDAGHATVTDDYDFTPQAPFTLGGNAVPAIAKGIKFDCVSFPSVVASFQMDYPAGFTEYAASCQMVCSFNDPGGAAQEMDVLGGYDSNGVLCVQLGRTDGHIGFGDYKPHGTPNGAGQRVWRVSERDFVFWRVKGDRMMFYVLDDTWAWVGCSSVVRGGGDIVVKFIQDYIAPHGNVDELVYGPIHMNLTTQPLYHGVEPTIPAPTNVEVEVTGADEVTVTWESTCDWFKLEMWDGTSWSTVEEFAQFDNHGTPSQSGVFWEYIESGLEVGDIRAFRVTARFGDDETNCMESEVSDESDPVEIEATGPAVTDAFTGYNDPLGSNANWTARLGNIGITSFGGGQECYPGSSGFNSVEYTATAPLGANHASEATERTLTDDSGLIGPAVRIQSGSGDCYGLLPGNTTLYLIRRIGGSTSFALNYSRTLVVGDRHRLNVTGTGSATRLEIVINDVVFQTNIDPGAGGIAYLDGGGWGLCANSVSGAARLDDWAGYNL